jgi:hypothetical protein
VAVDVEKQLWTYRSCFGFFLGSLDVSLGFLGLCLDAAGRRIQKGLQVDSKQQVSSWVDGRPE